MDTSYSTELAAIHECGPSARPRDQIRPTSPQEDLDFLVGRRADLDHTDRAASLRSGLFRRVVTRTSSGDLLVAELRFTFRERWKEEIVCECAAGALVLAMPLGNPRVEMPPADEWLARAPVWARQAWESLHHQLEAYGAQTNLPLAIVPGAYVYEETPGVIARIGPA